MNKEKLSKLQSVLDEMVDTGYVAGVSALVIKGGQEQGYFEAGYQDLSSQKKLSRDTIFRMYSMTKPVTATAAMILLEEGKIDLFDPVSKYLPGFKNQKVIRNGIEEPVKKEMTIQNLLNMTSGLTYGGESSAAECRSQKLIDEIVEKLDTPQALTTVEIANRIGQQPLAFHPGEKWQYGFSADVLAALVEVVSGMRYSDFLQEKIFLPLGMKDTGFFVPEDKQDRLTKIYRQTENGLIEELYPNLGVSVSQDKLPAFESGGAGLVSTIDDYSRFAQMLLNGGSLDGVKILSPATVEFMTTAHVTPQQQESVNSWESLAGYTYGNLLRIMDKPELALGLGSKGEYGWDGWLGTYMVNDPAHDLTFLIMQQRADSGTTGYTRRMRNIVFSA